MTLRISAVAAILIGLLFAWESVVGMSAAYKFAQGQETYITEQFAVRFVIVLALLAGGALAIWRGWRVLLASAWGIIFGMTAPHLFRLSIPAALINQIARGGNTYSVSVDPREAALVGIALVGLVLCGISEWNASRQLTTSG